MSVMSDVGSPVVYFLVLLFSNDTVTDRWLKYISPIILHYNPHCRMIRVALNVLSASYYVR